MIHHVTCIDVNQFLSANIVLHQSIVFANIVLYRMVISCDLSAEIVLYNVSCHVSMFVCKPFICQQPVLCANIVIYHMNI